MGDSEQLITVVFSTILVLRDDVAFALFALGVLRLFIAGSSDAKLRQ